MNTSENANAGTLDPLFGDMGIATIDLPIPAGYARYTRQVKTLGTGPTARIYVLVEATGYFLGRLNDDGTPDNTFGDNGIVRAGFPEGVIVNSFAIQADGKIVLQGYVTDIDSTTTLFTRFELDGKLDLSFGSDGYTSVNFKFQTASTAPHDHKLRATSSNASLASVEILPDGKILACNQKGWFIRLTPEGFLDTTFNNTGYVRVVHPEYPAGAIALYQVQSQTNGKYVGCGFIIGEPNQAYFVRVDNTGLIDKTFGPCADGFLVIEGSKDSGGFALDTLARQPNQRILGAGYTFAHASQSAVMTSIEPDGTPNIQFNRGEPLYTSLEAGKKTIWSGTTVQQDGKIVVAGGLVSVPSGEFELVVARYLNETPDASFGDGRGWVITALPVPGGGYATSIALQADRKIVVAAAASEGNKGMIVRYLP